MRRTISLGLVIATGLLIVPPSSAQNVALPAAGVIRGENIRLWAEPSFDAEELEVLQRGDAITITSEAVAAEGDEFYPVEFAETGEAGWVRTIFVNPDSLVAVHVLEPATEERQNRRNQNADETPVEQAGGEQGGASANEESRAERRAQRQAEQDTAAQEATVDQVNNPVPVELTPVEETPEPAPADDEDQAPADDASPADTAGTVTLAGEGSVTTDPVALLAGDYVVTLTSEVTAPSDVVVRLIDADEQAQRLFRESVGAQSWTAETDVTIESDGDYTVRVSGLEDAWIITFTPSAAS